MQMPSAERCSALDAQAFDGVLVDLDGVVTRTASLHAAAWKQLFDEILARKSAGQSTRSRSFDPIGDYQTYVDGKPRMDGLKAFLAARKIELPLGDPNDPPTCDTLYGLNARKDTYFQALIEDIGVAVEESSLDFLRRARDKGWKTAVVSSSRNCVTILAAAGLSAFFDVRVDGTDLEAMGLRGKPEPDAYREAAARLQIQPARAVVIEDALVGVRAGRAGGFACVIGLDHGGQRDAFLAAGADLVVQDLSVLSISDQRGATAQSAKPNALTRFNKIAQRLRGRRLALFLDYDGTLTPIVERPELAKLSHGMRAALEKLSKLCAIAIVSGRERHNVAGLVGLKNLYYAGSHGFDISGPAGQRIHYDEGREFVPVLAAAERELRSGTSTIEGALIEGKTYAVAAHYRLVAPRDLAAFHSLVAEVAAHHPELRVTSGKKVLELRPAINWDKGKAVLWLLGALKLDANDTIPIYVGDDVTDEDAFEALKDEGVGILVSESPPPTAAHYLLRDPAEVRQFLERLARLLQGASR